MRTVDGWCGGNGDDAMRYENERVLDANEGGNAAWGEDMVWYAWIYPEQCICSTSCVVVCQVILFPEADDVHADRRGQFDGVISASAKGLGSRLRRYPVPVLLKYSLSQRSFRVRLRGCTTILRYCKLVRKPMLKVDRPRQLSKLIARCIKNNRSLQYAESRYLRMMHLIVMRASSVDKRPS
jgi:hypothetical protein